MPDARQTTSTSRRISGAISWKKGWMQLTAKRPPRWRAASQAAAGDDETPATRLTIKPA